MTPVANLKDRFPRDNVHMVQGLVYVQSFTFDIRIAIFLHCLGLTPKEPITTKVICFVVC